MKNYPKWKGAESRGTYASGADSSHVEFYSTDDYGGVAFRPGSPVPGMVMGIVIPTYLFAFQVDSMALEILVLGLRFYR